MMDAFYDNVDKRLRESNLSRSELAEKIGIPKTTVQSWFNRKSRIALESAAKISEALGVSLDMLCGLSPATPTNYNAFNDGNTSFCTVLETIDKLLSSVYLNFRVSIQNTVYTDDLGEDIPIEYVSISTFNQIILDYYKVYCTMKDLVSNKQITPAMFYDLLNSKRFSLSDRKIDGSTPASMMMNGFTEIDESELPF